MFKGILWILLIIALCTFLLPKARAEYIDLRNGGIQLAVAPCEHNGKQVACVLVTKNDKLYGIVIDEKGEAEIVDLTGDEPKLIWSRDSV
jgi:hypothetical protein